MNNMTKTMILDTKHCHNLLGIILRSGINIADFASKSFDDTLLASDIHPNTFAKSVKLLKAGTPHFDGPFKYVSPLTSLSIKMLGEVQVYADRNKINLSPEDIAIIKCYILLIAMHFLNAINRKYLTEAISMHGRGVHCYRLDLVQKAKTELCEQFANQSLYYVLCSLINDTQDTFNYIARIEKSKNDSDSFSFKIFYCWKSPDEYLSLYPLIIQY